MQRVCAEPLVECARQEVLVREGHGLTVRRKGEMESHDPLPGPEGFVAAASSLSSFGDAWYEWTRSVFVNYTERHIPLVSRVTGMLVVRLNETAGSSGGQPVVSAIALKRVHLTAHGERGQY